MLFKETILLRAFGWAKIPLIGLLRPKVLKLDSEACEILIPRGYWSKNHWGSLYFGALAVGADIAGGLYAMTRIQREKLPVSLIFKDFKAVFLKRPDAHTVFRCADSGKIDELIARTLASSERQDVTVLIEAFLIQDKQFKDPVARFDLTVSLKASRG